MSAATILKKGLFFEPPLDNLNDTDIYFPFLKVIKMAYFCLISN